MAKNGVSGAGTSVKVQDAAVGAWRASRSGLEELVFRGEKSRRGVQAQDRGLWPQR